MRPYTFVITCEHGGNQVPKAYQQLFIKEKKILDSHRGYDIGALTLAKKLAKSLHSPLFFSTTTRLLVELNRSLTSRSLFSEFTKPLSKDKKIEILEKYYFPYREKVEKYIQEKISNNETVVHLSIHTFTPTLHGKKRNTDIGLLYDPQSDLEKKFCDRLFLALKEKFLVRRNYPYRGISDGLTTHLRSVYGAKRYIGIEIEVNQKFPLSHPKHWSELQKFMALSLK